MCFIHFFWPISKDNVGPLPSELGRGSVLRTVSGAVGLQQVRFSPACLSALHLSKQPGCRRPCHRWAVLGWEGKFILGTRTFFPPFFVCLATWKWAVKRGQCMDFMVKQNHWRAGHRFWLLLLLLSLFNYLCSKWMKQL